MMKIDSFRDFEPTVTNVDLRRQKVPANWQFKCSNRHLYGLVFILAGIAEYIFQNRVEKAYANDIVFLKKGDNYRINTVSGDQHSFIVISFDLEKDIDLPFKTINKITHTKRFLEMFKAIEEMRFTKGIGYKLCCRSMVQMLIYYMLIEHLETAKTAQDLQASIEYIENNYDKKISIQTLASIAGISQSHYRRKFKQAYGVAPNEYINKLRIEKAKDMLKSNMFTQSEIANLCGFENVYYFSRVFKKFTKIPPGSY